MTDGTDARDPLTEVRAALEEFRTKLHAQVDAVVDGVLKRLEQSRALVRFEAEEKPMAVATLNSPAVQEISSRVDVGAIAEQLDSAERNYCLAALDSGMLALSGRL